MHEDLIGMIACNLLFPNDIFLCMHAVKFDTNMKNAEAQNAVKFKVQALIILTERLQDFTKKADPK